MQRGPNGTCAGCARPIYLGRGSRPQGAATCQACRAEGRGPVPRAPRPCRVCQAPFVPPRGSKGSRVTCTDACFDAFMQAAAQLKAAANLVTERPCPDCGQLVLGGHSTRRCPPCRAVRSQASNRRKNVKRRGAQMADRTLTLPELGRREGWRCHLCLKRVDQRLKSPHPMSPTFDHLIPISEDGDDAPENLRLAHRTCNVKRGTGGIVQLLLVG